MDSRRRDIHLNGLVPPRSAGRQGAPVARRLERTEPAAWRLRVDLVTTQTVLLIIAARDDTASVCDTSGIPRHAGRGLDSVALDRAGPAVGRTYVGLNAQGSSAVRWPRRTLEVRTED
ncbi:MAG: hypothetical protein DMD81_14535 [Candidatus Rokuibacteriota bacterium]|nr:MAG: hypothetical protein DMD81_14535 [Candidatus Rokubacteria bacterium]